MTHMNKWKYLLTIALSIGALSLALLPPVAHAQTPPPTSCDSSFLGFPAWYNGLTGSDCDIKSPSDPTIGGVDKFIWIIVFNIVKMLLLAAGYAAAIFIIYGGYKYMISTGSADGVAGAKKTIMNAVIGLVLSIAAIAIVNTISKTFGLGG